MRKIPSKTRRNLVVAGAAGLATLAAPKVWQTRLVQSAAAQEIPPKTDEIKVQYAHRTGRWGIGANGTNSIPLQIDNQFGQGTVPVVHEVQIHFRLDFPAVKDLSVDLISPSGTALTLMYRPGDTYKKCSGKGVDITLVDTEQENCCEGIENAYKYCPEHTASNAAKFFRTWELKVLKGVFHTHTNDWHRALPLFNGEPAVGTWHFRAKNHQARDINKVIRQIDLTVYSKW